MSNLTETQSMPTVFTPREIAEILGTEEWRIRRLCELRLLPEPASSAGNRADNGGGTPGLPSRYEIVVGSASERCDTASDTVAAGLDALIKNLNAMLERTTGNSRRFMSAADAAGYAGLSPKTIRRLIASGRLTALRPVRGRVLIDVRELDAFVLGMTSGPRRGRGSRVSGRVGQRPDE